MKKFVGSTIFAVFVLVLAASIAIFLVSVADAKPAIGKTWTVVMKFKDAALEPKTRIYIEIDAETEGQAAIDANKFLYDKLTPDAYSKLQYLEAQQKK